MNTICKKTNATTGPHSAEGKCFKTSNPSSPLELSLDNSLAFITFES